ncbi:MAG: T9SS type A sorting domain-containing protein [Saprospiraceae bacterium]|nr:T9SS type A sorting domain-containing protein [Saprospiraceae bacterium]
MKRKVLFQFIFSLLIINMAAQSVSTNREIYNYDVGDIFHYSHEISSPSSGANITSNVEIIGKYYSLGQDTIFYIRDIVSKQSGSGIPVSYKYRIDTISYTNLDSAVNGGIIDSVYYDITQYNGRKINRDTNSFLDLYADSLGKVFDMIYHDFNYMTQNQKRLIYYKKGSEEWGTPINLAIKESNITSLDFKIYPNPATDFIAIVFSEALWQDGFVEIYNINGVLIRKEKLNTFERTYELSVKTFKTGLYLGKIVQKNGLVQSFKFVVE